MSDDGDRATRSDVLALTTRIRELEAQLIRTPLSPGKVGGRRRYQLHGLRLELHRLRRRPFGERPFAGGIRPPFRCCTGQAATGSLPVVGRHVVARAGFYSSPSRLAQGGAWRIHLPSMTLS